MMSKRILSSIILVVMLITCTVPAFALTDFGSLRAIGIMSDCIYAKGENELITRAELAYITASLMDKNERAPMDTRFCDVDATNEYSGYIEFLAVSGIVNGTGGCAFIPDGSVTFDVANKMLLSAIGYGALCEEIGGYPEGYRTIARALGLNKGVSAAEGGNLTTEAIAVMVTNLLETPLPGMGIQTGDTSSNLIEKDTSVLGNILGISVYEGKIDNIDADKQKLTFVVSENVYPSNPVKVTTGGSIILGYDDYDKVQKYDNAPSVVYVDENKEIVYIEEAEGVEISYRVINSINGNANTTSKYSVTNMDEVTFLDDNKVYDVSDSAELKYNNKLTRTSVKLIGNTARVVTMNDEVIYIESWNLTEGGIITDINSEEITYTSGEKSGIILTELHLYDNMVVIVDGEPAGYGLIRNDALFDYYIEDNFAVFVVSNKKIVDKFNGVGTGDIELGSVSYDTRNVYYSRDGEKYTKNADYGSMLNLVVDAYVGPDGYVRYVKPSANQKLEISKFYGVVCGVDEPAGLNTETRIQLWKIDNEITKEVYKINKNTVMNDDITLSELIDKSADFEAGGIYVFETAPNLAVQTISRPKKVRGFENVKSTTSEPILFRSSDDNRVIHHNGIKFVAMYTDKNGDFTVEYCDSSVIRQKEKNVDFFSLNGDLNVSFALIHSDLADRMTVGDGGTAILIQKRNVLTDNGKSMTELTLLVAGGKEKRIVSNAVASSLKLYSIIAYGSASAYLDEDIVIKTDPAPFVLDADCDNWKISEEATGYHFAYIEDISSDKIALSDGMVYSFNGQMNFLAEYDRSDTKNPFRNIDLKYLSEGDYVYYYVRNNSSRYIAVNGLIVIR